MLVWLGTIFSKRSKELYSCVATTTTASVTETLHKLGWTTLELRRTMTHLILLYKMSQGQIDIDTDAYLHPHTEFRTHAGHSYTPDKTTKNTYFYSFFPRTIRQWNTVAYPLSVTLLYILSQSY